MNTDDSYIVDMARNLYGCDEIDIESGAEVSLAEDGAWVQGWFWVPRDAWQAAALGELERELADNTGRG